MNNGRHKSSAEKLAARAEIITSGFLCNGSDDRDDDDDDDDETFP